MKHTRLGMLDNVWLGNHVRLS